MSKKEANFCAWGRSSPFEVTTQHLVCFASALQIWPCIWQLFPWVAVPVPQDWLKKRMNQLVGRTGWDRIGRCRDAWARLASMLWLAKSRITCIDLIKVIEALSLESSRCLIWRDSYRQLLEDVLRHSPTITFYGRMKLCLQNLPQTF